MTEHDDSATAAPTAEQVTLATLREWAERVLEILPDPQQGTSQSGQRQAAREVLAILDANGLPPGRPVNMPPWED